MKTVENFVEFNLSDESAIICQDGITHVVCFDFPTIGGWIGNTPKISKVVECWNEEQIDLPLDNSVEKLNELQVLINKNYSYETNV
jgi:hypothetical protein